MSKLIPANEWLNGDVKEIKFAKKEIGKKGQLLVELQKSFKGDERFKMNSKFDEVDVEKLPRKFKDINSQLINQEDEEIVEEVPINEEVNQQLNILTQLLPEHRAFITHQKKTDKKKYNLIIPKFDPSNIDKRLLINKEEQQQQKNKAKNKNQQIVKGVDKKIIKMEKADKLLKRQDNHRKVEVKINKTAWKDIIQKQDNNNNNNCLFS